MKIVEQATTSAHRDFPLEAPTPNAPRGARIFLEPREAHDATRKAVDRDGQPPAEATPGSVGRGLRREKAGSDTPRRIPQVARRANARAVTS